MPEAICRLWLNYTPYTAKVSEEVNRKSPSRYTTVQLLTPYTPTLNTTTTTDKLQRVMNAAARVISNTQKYDSGLSLLLHDELHWLDVVDRVRYKLAVRFTASVAALSVVRYHGVEGLTLWRTVTTGQCLSSSCVITVYTVQCCKVVSRLVVEGL